MLNKSEKCELCAAANENYRVIEKNDLAFSIVIIEPLVEGHLLVLPLAHRRNIGELTAAESKAIMDMLNKLALAMRNAYKLEPLIAMNYGKHGTQEHVHFHIFPYNAALRTIVAHHKNMPERIRANKKELSKVAEKIKKELVHTNKNLSSYE